MSTDLGLDPNDPLSLLLQPNGETAMEESGSSQSEGPSPQDWSQLSSLWDGTDAANTALKAYPDLMDFSELNSLPMDMDFNPALGMEPGALHYDPLKFNPMHFPYEDAAFHNVSSEMIPPQFSFTFQQALNASVNSFTSSASTSSLSSPESPSKERRLSVTSSSSSSGASLSPVLDSVTSPSSSYAGSTAPSPSPVKVEVNRPTEQSKASDAAAELAERVRQSAGVMLAVPMSADLSSQVLAHSIASAGSSNRLAIPRQSRTTEPRSPMSSSSSAASTPPPSTPPMNSSLPNKLTMGSKPISSSSSSSGNTPANVMPPLTGVSGRPKTSHTTIERRYRTNLNARIQSLRMAVPALRVLEDRDGGNGKKIKKNLKDGVYLKGAGIGIDTEDGTTVDVIDERGFVDGVKVARKCSKANVLGKAVEYIRVLKRREIRLKAEQNGLKALISGLVGGPALLKDWEQRWRESFGGEEKDEVEGEEEDDDSDDDDGEDDDESAGRKRKRPKTTAPPAKKPAAERKPAVPSGLAELAPGAPAPEKRKRGRPRKMVPPPMPVATLAPHVSHQQAAAMAQHQQQMHQDQMMHAPEHRQQAPQYMMAVFALFSFFNSPLTSQFTSKGAHQHSGMVLTPPLALAPEIVSQLVPPPAESSSRFLHISWAWKDYLQVIHLAVSVLVLGGFLWSWLGSSLRKRKDSKEAPATLALSTTTDGKTNWTTVCNDAVLEDKSGSMSTLSLARAYFALSSTKTATISQLTTLSLLLNNARGGIGFAGRLKAQSLWNAAKHQSQLLQTARSTKPPAKTFEKLVMESFELEDAFKTLADASPNDKTNGESALSPIEVLGATIVKQRVKQHLGALFVEAVSLSQDEIVEQEKEESKNLESEIRRTIEAAKELRGDIEELGCNLERVWKSSSATLLDDINLDEVDEAEHSGVDGEIKALLIALVLYKRMFSGSNTPTVSSLLISPPPSPTARQTKEGKALLSLRKALGCRVFEDSDKDGSMEDARDKVVDLIVDTERRGKCFA